MLVYLHQGTWRVGEASTAFAQEVALALRCGVQLLLAHEMPGADQASRGGVESRPDDATTTDAAFYDALESAPTVQPADAKKR